MERPTVMERDPVMQQCIDDCLDSFSVCTETQMHCLEMGGDHAAPDHLRLLQDCAEICQLAATFMLRKSELSTDLCELCAEAAEACAVSCDQFADDVKMATCAEVARRTAESCRRMAGQLGMAA
jgi:hypothetical protein